MRRNGQKQVAVIVCVGAALVGTGLWKGNMQHQEVKAEEAPVQTVPKMWGEDSPNSYKQVMEEINRLNQLFKKSVGLHEAFINTYKEEGHIPTDYKKQLADIVVASPYDEVQPFVKLHKQYKIAQKEYFDYINQQSNWNKEYLEEQEQMMSGLIRQYIAQLDKIRANQ